MLLISCGINDHEMATPIPENPRKYPYPPTEGKLRLSFIHFHKLFWSYRNPPPPEIPIPSVGEYGCFLELNNVHFAYEHIQCSYGLTVVQSRETFSSKR